jgi:hypothetical protein
MNGPPLSFETTRRLEQVFPPQLRADAALLLAGECGWNLPFCENATPTSLERIRFAALKLSNGTMSGLLAAIQVAQIDWRDLLVAAGFADDVNTHVRWLGSEPS